MSSIQESLHKDALVAQTAFKTLSAGAGAPFSDVPRRGIGQPGVIAFAKYWSILDGVGGNMYAPRGTLTKAEWVKILICALGYGQNDESIGIGWDSRAYETAANQHVDLFGTYNHAYGDKSFLLVPEEGFAEPISREETIALFYNAVLKVRTLATSGQDFDLTTNLRLWSNGV